MTAHGSQSAAPTKRDLATAYYGPKSGVGLVLEGFKGVSQKGLNVGVVGLGVGTLAAYGQEGDRYRFYEINPAVVSYAKGKGGYFSYLQDSKADIELVVGDARVALQKESERRKSVRFDVLVLDAFLGHAVPVHLLTREAFDLYLDRLDPNGIILVHIGNPHIDLKPQLESLARHFELESGLFESRGDGVLTEDAVWVGLARHRTALALPVVSAGVRDLLTDQEVALWTDQFSNLFQVLR